MNLLVTGAFGVSAEQMNRLKELGHTIHFMQFEKDNLPCGYEEVEGVICNGLFLYHPIEKFKNLKYIQLTSAGFDRVPMDYIEAKGIKIHNAKGVYSIPMAEAVVCGVLCLYRKMNAFFESQKTHKWEKQRNLVELYGKKVLIIGAGNVGYETAVRFKAMGCSVEGIDIKPYESPTFSKIYPLNDLDQSLSSADIVVLTLPLTKETENLLNCDRINKLKDSAVVCNIARGGVVDYKALCSVLKDKKIFGAVLDVFDEEPLNENSVLWDLDNVVLTPHNSFVGNKNNERLFNVAYSNLKKEEF